MVEYGKKMTPEQMLEAAKEEGYELSDEELEGIAGGGEWKNECCPRCGHTGTMYNPGTKVSRCGKCGLTW
jgi:ribosomal protein S27AE